MPIDPFETLLKRLDLVTFDPFDEALETPPDVLQYVKKVMILPAIIPKSETVWKEDYAGACYNSIQR